MTNRERETKTLEPIVKVGGKMRTVVGKYVADASQIGMQSGQSVEDAIKNLPSAPGGSGGSASVDRPATETAMGYKVLKKGSPITDTRCFFELKILTPQTQAGNIGIKIGENNINLSCPLKQKGNEYDYPLFLFSKNGNVVYQVKGKYYYQDSKKELTEDELKGATFEKIMVPTYKTSKELLVALYDKLRLNQNLYTTYYRDVIKIKVLKLGSVQCTIENTSGANIEKTDKPKEETINLLDILSFKDANTIYEVRDSLDLDGDTVECPQNSVLLFNGGKFQNGLLKGYNTTIKADLVEILTDVVCQGKFMATECYPEWFGAKTLQKRTTDAVGNDAIHSSVFEPPAEIETLEDSSDAILKALELSVISGCKAKLSGFIYRTNKTVRFPEKSKLDSVPETIVFPFLEGNGRIVTTQDEEKSSQGNKEAFRTDELSEPVRKMKPNQYIATIAMEKAFYMNSIYNSFVGGGTISLIKSKYTIGIYIEGTGFRQMDMTYLSPQIDIVVVGGNRDINTPDSDSREGHGVPTAPPAEEAAKIKDGSTYWDKADDIIYIWHDGKWNKSLPVNNEYNTSLRLEVYWGWGGGRIINPQIQLRDSYGYRGIEICTRSDGWCNVGYWDGSVSYKSGNYISIYTNYDVSQHDMTKMQMQYNAGYVTHDSRMVFAIRCGNIKFPFCWDVSWAGGWRLQTMWELGKYAVKNEIQLDNEKYLIDRGENNVYNISAKLRNLAKLNPIDTTEYVSILENRTPKSFFGLSQSPKTYIAYAENHKFEDDLSEVAKVIETDKTNVLYDGTYTTYIDVLTKEHKFATIDSLPFSKINAYPGFIVVEYLLLNVSNGMLSGREYFAEMSYEGTVFALRNSIVGTPNGIQYRANRIVLPFKNKSNNVLSTLLKFRANNIPDGAILRICNIKIFLKEANLAKKYKRVDRGTTADRPDAALRGMRYYDTDLDKAVTQVGTSENSVWSEGSEIKYEGIVLKAEDETVVTGQDLTSILLGKRIKIFGTLDFGQTGKATNLLLSKDIRASRHNILTERIIGNVTAQISKSDYGQWYRGISVKSNKAGTQYFEFEYMIV